MERNRHVRLTLSQVPSPKEPGDHRVGRSTFALRSLFRALRQEQVDFRDPTRGISLPAPARLPQPPSAPPGSSTAPAARQRGSPSPWSPSTPCGGDPQRHREHRVPDPDDALDVEVDRCELGSALNNVMVTPAPARPVGDCGSGAAISAVDDPRSPGRPETGGDETQQKGRFPPSLCGGSPFRPAIMTGRPPAGTVTFSEVDPRARFRCCHWPVSRRSPPAPGVRLSPHRALHVS
jgi:hypothetical protein